MSNDYTPGGGVDPTMIQALIQMLTGMGGNQSWQGAADPNLLSQLSFGFDPTQMQSLSLPQIPGTSEPDDVGYIEEASKQYNVSQDLVNLTGLGDLGYAAMMGPGSFGANTFEPTVTNELIQQPATLQFQRYLAPGNEGTFEGRVARVITGADAEGKPGTVSEAVGQMRRVIEFADAHPDDAQAQADADLLRPYLPSQTFWDQGIEHTIIDWSEATRRAQDLVDPYLAEQSIQLGPTGATYDPATGKSTPGGEIVEIDGQLYRQTSTPSPAAEDFLEAGIPPPNERYTPADILGPDWTQANESYLASLPGLHDLYAQYQSDIDRANGRAEMLGGMPMQEFYDRNSIPGQGGGTIDFPDTGAPLSNDIVTAIANNAAGAVGEAAGNAGTTAFDLARHGASLLGGGIGWGATAMRDYLNSALGGRTDSADIQTEPGGQGAPRTVEEGAAAQGNYGELGFRGQPLHPALRPMGGQTQPPGPGDDNSYLEYVLTASPGNRLSYDDWLEARAGAGNNVLGPAPTAAPAPQPGGGTTPADLGQFFGVQPPAPVPAANNPASRNVNTMASNPAAGGQIDITQLPSTAPPQPVTGQYNTNTQTAYPTGQPVLPMGGAAANNPALRGLGGQTGGPAGGRLSQAGIDAMLTAALAQGSGEPYANEPQSRTNRTATGGPVGGRRDQAMLDALLTAALARENERYAIDPAGRTNRTSTGGPVGGRGYQRENMTDVLNYGRGSGTPTSGAGGGGGRASFWNQLFPPDQQPGYVAPPVLRYGTDTQTSAGRVRNRRDLAVDRERAKAARVESQARETRYAQNMAYRANYGRDYWLARGYTDQLARMGVTPTAMAIANRIGGTNATLGRG